MQLGVRDHELNQILPTTTLMITYDVAAAILSQGIQIMSARLVTGQRKFPLDWAGDRAYRIGRHPQLPDYRDEMPHLLQGREPEATIVTEV